MKSKILARAIALEAKLDTTLFGVYRGPDGKFYKEDGTEAGAGDFKSVGGAVKAAGVGAAIGGGVLAGRKIAANYGADQIAKPGDALRAVTTGVGRDVSTAATNAGNFVKNKATTAGNAFLTGVNRDGGKFAKKSLWRGVKGAVAAVSGGKIKLSAVRQRLVEMGA